MAKWNVRLMDHNRCPMGTHWLMVDALYKHEAVERYCRDGDHQKWEDGDRGRVRVAEDGWVGEPTDYEVTAYKTHHDGVLNFQLDPDLSTCAELTDDGERGVILQDFNAG